MAEKMNTQHTPKEMSGLELFRAQDRFKNPDNYLRKDLAEYGEKLLSHAEKLEQDRHAVMASAEELLTRLDYEEKTKNLRNDTKAAISGLRAAIAKAESR